MDIQKQLGELFKNNKVKFCMYMDNASYDNSQKIIYAKVTDRTQDISKNSEIKITPKEECVDFEISEILALKPLKVSYTYDSDYGEIYLKWFKPILRNIINDKYELEGDVISDALMGLEYCQVRDDGILLFTNMSDLLEFTI